MTRMHQSSCAAETPHGTSPLWSLAASKGMAKHADSNGLGAGRMEEMAKVPFAATIDDCDYVASMTSIVVETSE